MSTPAPVIQPAAKKIPWNVIGGVVAAATLVIGLVILFVKFFKTETPSSPPTEQTQEPTCPSSMVVVKNPSNWRELKPGTYPLDTNSYEMKVWPPLQVEAYGGSNAYVKYIYQAENNTTCPNYSNLVLDRDKNWTKLVLTAI